LHRASAMPSGWPPERYEKWLTEALVDQLLAPTSG
jgi:hypothetical protein